MQPLRLLTRLLPAGLLALAAPLTASAQLLTNNGAALTLKTGLTLAVNGDVLNKPGGSFANAGEVQLTGNLTSTATVGSLSGPGEWRFVGGQDQTLQVPPNTSLGVVEQASTGPAGNNRLLVPQNLTVTGGLLLSGGLVRTAPAAFITLMPGATMSGETSGHYVQGNLEVLRNATGITDFGHGLVLDATGQTLGTVSATRTAGLATAGISYGTGLGTNPKGIDRVWSIEPVAQPTAPVPLTFSWPADDDNGLTNFLAAQLWQQPTGGGAWAAVGTPGNAASRSITRSAAVLNRFTISGSVAVAPTLTNLAPASGNPSTVVTLTGTDFTGATGVSFNGVPANGFTVLNATTATATPPNGGTTGNVTITTPAGTSNGLLFTYVSSPQIISFTPHSGPVGTVITITGTSLTGTNSIVFAGPVPAGAFTVVNGTTVMVTVPAGAASGFFDLYTPYGSTNSPQPFTVTSPSLAPTLTSVNPTSGSVGTVVTLTGTNFTGATGVRFNGLLTNNFSVVNPTTATVVVPVGAVTGDVTIVTPVGISNGQFFTVTLAPAPSLTSVLSDATGLSSGPVGASVTLTGTGLTAATLVSFAGALNNTVSSGLVVNGTGTQLSGVLVPTGAISGLVSVTTPGGTTNSVVFTVTSAASFPDLVINTPSQSVAGGTYNSITVTGTGAGTLQGPVQVNTAVLVQSGGTLSTNCQPLTGAATFTLQAGGTLTICHPAGISQSGATGAVQTTGVRSFSNDAHYSYNGSVSQITGSGLPAQVRSLTLSNPTVLTLTQALAVRQRVRLTNTGDLALNGLPLTLLSDATGTALVANESTGVVSGNTATMQRYLDPSGNTGASGYRHYSSPVLGATVASLTTAGFTPTVNPAYNSSPTPGTVTPFPTVFDYNEAFITARSNNLSAFDKGWSSPAALNAPLGIGRGYTVQIGNAEKVAFTGTLCTGDRFIGNLSRGSDPDAGWALIGNPYPAPLDWNTVGQPNTGGSVLNLVDAAAYVFQSTGPYTGQYRAVVNGVGAGSSLIAAGQGFFVRTSTSGALGSITLTNANRLTTFGASQPVFQRGTASARPLLRLSLGLGSPPATPATAQDETFVYFETGATAAFDGSFDAHKMANPSAYYLATQGPAAAPALSINGRAPLTAGQADEVLPLWFAAPAGTYTLTATELANFTALAGGTTVYLRDALAGSLTNLSQTPTYAFTAAAGAPASGRFSLVFRTSTALATSPGRISSGAAASLYPNPSEAHAAGVDVTLAVTGLDPAARRVKATLLNSLGQTVGHCTLAVSQGAGRTAVPTMGLAAGVYLVRLQVLDAQGQSAGTLPAQRLQLR